MSHLTSVLPFDASSIAHAATLIRAGQCVAVPTETVYGLAADATNALAVARIYEAKGRPGFNPLIVHVASREAAETLAVFDAEACALADRFWPGPLTLVLPARGGSPIAGIATAGLPTIALRLSSHPAMRALIAACGKPLAAPSANASGRLSPTQAAHVSASLGGRIPLIIDDGPTQAGVESTIVASTGKGLRLLRPGPITAEALGLSEVTPTNAIEAPGQLESHYKPIKPVTLNVAAREGGSWLIGFGAVMGDASLSPGGNLLEAAANLFARLHEADAAAPPRIAVAPIPINGLGAAINDRLARAAAI